MKSKEVTLGAKFILTFGLVYLAFALTFTLSHFLSSKQTLEDSITKQMEKTMEAIVTVVQTSINTTVKSYLRYSAEILQNDVYTAFENNEADISETILEIVNRPASNAKIKSFIITSDGTLITPHKDMLAGTSMWNQRDSNNIFYIQELISRAYVLPKGAVNSISYVNGNDVMINVFFYFETNDWIIVQEIARKELKDFINVYDFRDNIVSLRLGKNGSVEIFDEIGLQLVHSGKQFEGNIRTTETHSEINKLKNGKIRRRERLAEVSSLEYVTTSSVTDNQKLITKIYNFQEIPDMNWYISVGVDEREVFRPLINLGIISAILTIFFFIILLSLSLIVSEKLILGNLRMLTYALDAFARKDFSVRTEISSRDELEILGKRFNSMAATIQDYSHNLEELIKERTAKLVQAEKMAALGGIIAGVAHEINTPVGTSFTAASFINKQAKNARDIVVHTPIDSKSLMNSLNNINEGSEIIYSSLAKAGELIKRFKMIAIDQSIEHTKTFKIRQYIEDIKLSLNHEIKNRNVRFHINCDDSLAINTDPSYFYQIISNFIMNTLIHGYNNGEVADIFITVKKDNNTLKLIFSDKGKGIPEEILPHIFEPFITTKRNAGGTGLGMHIIYNLVVKNLEGTITCVESEGAEFQISIPWDKVKP
jgi:signal transduction histidine kinase